MKRFNSLFLLLILALSFQKSFAQSWYKMHVGYEGNSWSFPISQSDVSVFNFTNLNSRLSGQLMGDDSFSVPFDLRPTATVSDGYHAYLDSISFVNEIPTSVVKDKYKTFAIHITTLNSQPITSKENYVPCFISVDGMGQYAPLSISGRIRGRGNSTWLWYDKKPYRIKFDASNKLLGIKKNKDWVLLANYRDVTKMMNTFCFIAADCMGMPFTTPIRYAEVFLNSQYVGLYQVAEQVEVGSHRVDIQENGGLLMSLDVDDGPDYQPNSGDNFYSSVYRMPVCVKYPKNLSAEALDSVKAEFSVLEQAIKSHNMELVDSLMDIPSYISEIQLQELVFNVELSAPRSVYFFRDAGGKWTFGPAWDWDAGFDFSWTNMETSHKYFTSYEKSLLGSDPFIQNGEYKIPRFFTDLFCRTAFVKRYKEQWKRLSDTLITHCWAETQRYIDGLNTTQSLSDGRTSSPWKREQSRWPISGYKPDTEIVKMKNWLTHRVEFLNKRIANIPDTVAIESEVEYPLSASLSYRLGYNQQTTLTVDKYRLSQLFGVSLKVLETGGLSLFPVNSDGTVGENTAAGLYGAWFDAEGNTTRWSDGQMVVFIESDNLFQWNCGLYQFNCQVGDAYTVTMRYSLTYAGRSKTVDVPVKFSINQ